MCLIYIMLKNKLEVFLASNVQINSDRTVPFFLPCVRVELTEALFYRQGCLLYCYFKSTLNSSGSDTLSQSGQTDPRYHCVALTHYGP